MSELHPWLCLTLLQRSDLEWLMPFPGALSWPYVRCMVCVGCKRELVCPECKGELVYPTLIYPLQLYFRHLNSADMGSLQGALRPLSSLHALTVGGMIH